MKGLYAAFARNVVFSNIVLLLIFVGGGMAAVNLIRENFPELSFDTISIMVAYPGADPEEVEEGVTRKIESVIQGIEGIKECTTFSQENFASALIEVKEGFDTKEVLSKVRTSVSAIATFPMDAEKPIIQELTAGDPVLLLYLKGDMGERRLKEWSERVREELLAIPIVTQVINFGMRDYEISVEVSEQQLQQYGLSFAMVSDAIRRSNLNLAGGTLRTQGEEIRLRTMGRKYTGAELSEIVVRATSEGEAVTLGQVAQINDGFAENSTRALIDGESAVMVMVSKAKGEDSLAIAKAVNAYVAQKQAQLPKGASLKILYDNTELLQDRIDLLIENGIQGLIIVFASLWIFLNGRLAFWVGMGIPVSIAGALFILWCIGETINMISLFGLIMVLGILVDDAIVVGEAIYVHRSSGDPPLAAAINGVNEVGMPVITSVLTTIVAFVPLYFIKGFMGKMVAILPLVVASCLLVSLLEGLFLLPAHLSHLPDPNKKYIPPNALMRIIQRIQESTNQKMGLFVEWIYIPFLHKTLQYRYVLLCISISILMVTLGVVKSGFLKFEVMGDVDGFIIISTIEFPDGTPAEVTRSAIEKIDEALLRLAAKTETRTGEPLIKHRLTLMGQTLEQSSKSGSHVGSVEGILLDSEDRGIHYRDLLVQWEKEVGLIPGVKSLTFKGITGEPPGAPIEIWLQGKDMEQLITASTDVKERLRKLDGVFQIRSDYAPGKNEMRLSLKPEARGLGLTVSDLASQVYAGYYGYEVVRVQRGRENVGIKVRYAANERSNVSDLYRMRIRTLDGRQLPLMSVADVTFAPGYSTITRTNGLRRIAVSAGIDKNRANANEIYQELQKNFFPELKQKYYGLSIALQGEDKRMQEAFGSLKTSFPMAVVGIFVLIATMFRSYVQPLLILITIPFSVVGSIFGHLIMGYDLSMMSIFGIVAVAGVVVNDAIVLIERVNEYLAEGMPFFGSLILGAARRFRAIFLTTVSTVFGLLPLILETNFQAKFLIPMALSIAAGLIFATFLVIVQLPCLIAVLNDFRLFVRHQKTGAWVSRNAVEPATERYKEELEAPPSPGDKTIVLR